MRSAITDIVCNQCDSQLVVVNRVYGGVGAYCSSCDDEWPIACYDARTQSWLEEAARDPAMKLSASRSSPSRKGVDASTTPTRLPGSQKSKPASSRVVQPPGPPHTSRSRRSIKISPQALDRRTGRSSWDPPTSKSRKMIRGEDYVACSKCARRFHGDYLTAQENYVVHACGVQPAPDEWRLDM
jgi:hypothetical protein